MTKVQFNASPGGIVLPVVAKMGCAVSPSSLYMAMWLGACETDGTFDAGHEALSTIGLTGSRHELVFSMAELFRRGLVRLYWNDRGSFALGYMRGYDRDRLPASAIKRVESRSYPAPPVGTDGYEFDCDAESHVYDSPEAYIADVLAINAHPLAPDDSDALVREFCMVATRELAKAGIKTTPQAIDRDCRDRILFLLEKRKPHGRTAFEDTMAHPVPWKNVRERKDIGSFFSWANRNMKWLERDAARDAESTSRPAGIVVQEDEVYGFAVDKDAIKRAAMRVRNGDK